MRNERIQATLTGWGQAFYRQFIEPRSSEPDVSRQEYILNVLLCTLTALSVVVLIFSSYSLIGVVRPNDADAFLCISWFGASTAGLLWLSRQGSIRLAARLLVLLLAIGSLMLASQWGFMLPGALLACSVLIVVAGILLGAVYGLALAAGVAVVIPIIAAAQIHQLINPDLRWLQAPFLLRDGFGYGVSFVLFGLVSWLSNRETSRSLQRARLSEAALQRERDSLEIKVAERTLSLQESQRARELELQRFAEFGRLSASLLHEIANPLTAASLNLAQFDGRQTALVAEARRNLLQLERYVKAAQAQLKSQSHSRSFSVRREVQQVKQLLQPLAAKQGVQLQISQAGNYRLVGDPIKFNQLLANLVVNAIDAYAASKSPVQLKTIQIIIKSVGQKLMISVVDRASVIPSAHISQLFEPFFTTKLGDGRGLGIGLAMVKQIAEADFGGSVSAESSRQSGTCFTLKLRLAEHG